MVNLLFTFLLLFSTCSSSPIKEHKAVKSVAADSGKILIVYLSRTGNTRTIAEIIHKNVGGTLVALELKDPYPKDYKTTVDQVAKENESGYLPTLKTKIDNIEKYDVVFVGFPTWGMQLPPPIKSFLRQYPLGGKTVIPFNTNGGYGVGSSFHTVKELCPASNVLEGFSIRGGLERDGQYLVITNEKRKEAELKVKQWLEKTGMYQASSKHQ
jgi:flavodoxin